MTRRRSWRPATGAPTATSTAGARSWRRRRTKAGTARRPAPPGLRRRLEEVRAAVGPGHPAQADAVAASGAGAGARRPFPPPGTTRAANPSGSHRPARSRRTADTRVRRLRRRRCLRPDQALTTRPNFQTVEKRKFSPSRSTTTLAPSSRWWSRIMTARLVGHLVLDHPLERAGPVRRVVADLGQLGLGLGGDLEGDAPVGQAVGQVGQLDVDDVDQVGFGERMEAHDVVHPVDELGPEEVLADHRAGSRS